MDEPAFTVWQFDERTVVGDLYDDALKNRACIQAHTFSLILPNLETQSVLYRGPGRGVKDV